MNHYPSIQQAIRYIEDHLEEELPLDEVAAAAGFSMFHFHRLFQQHTGITAADYIRARRLADAASQLLYTEERLLDIALSCRFDSQEAFTRAFKKNYGLPPGRYRKLMRTIAASAGVEASQAETRDIPGQEYGSNREISHQTSHREGKESMEKREIKGWMLSGSQPHQYESGIDKQNVHSGKASAYLRSVSVGSDTPEPFATLMQMFKADQYKGERLRLSAFIKSENVLGFAGLWMRIDDVAGDPLQFDNMSSRPIKGTNNWNHYSVVLDVPESGACICFGVLLSGTGTVWMDRFTFEVVDKRVPTTNTEFSHDLLDEPMNLSFEDI